MGEDLGSQGWMAFWNRGGVGGGSSRTTRERDMNHWTVIYYKLPNFHVLPCLRAMYEMMMIASTQS